MRRRKRASVNVTPQRETFKSALMTTSYFILKGFSRLFPYLQIKMESKTDIRAVCVVISQKARGFVRETRTNGCLQALCRPSSDRVASAVSNQYFSHKRQLNQCLQSYSAGNRAALCSLARLGGRTRSNIGVSAIIPLSMTCRCPIHFPQLIQAESVRSAPQIVGEIYR